MSTSTVGAGNLGVQGRITAQVQVQPHAVVPPIHDLAFHGFVVHRSLEVDDPPSNISLEVQ